MTALLSLLVAAAPVTETWVALTSAGRIGVLKATTNGLEVSVDWKVDNNGRGPKITERIVFDAKGFIVRREITGTSDGGAPVKETFSWSAGKATWTSLDDSGEATSASPLYVDVHGAPWTVGVFVRTMLRRKLASIDVLPGGRLTLEKLRDFDIAPKDTVTAYALGGGGFDPVFVLMRKEALVGVVSPGFVLVEEKYESRFKSLSDLGVELVSGFSGKLAKRLTHRAEGPLWLVNVKVFDSQTGTIGEKATNVVLFRGRIVGLRSDPPPAGAQVIDGAGGTLLPGLFDAHSHQSATDGLLCVASGVTFVRDPGNDNETLLKLTSLYDSGAFVGPRVWKSGFLEGKSPFSAQFGFVVASQDEALEKVRWYADHGYWGLKIYNSMNPDWVKPIAAEAHRVGLHVSGHVPAFMTSERAVRDGYDEINHINQLMLGFLLKEKEDTRTPFRFTVIGDRMAGFDLKGPAFQNMLALMKQRKTTIDPTLAIFSGMILGRPGKANPSDLGFLDHLPPLVRRSRITSYLDVKPEQYPTWDASWKKLEQTMVLLHQSGIPLVPGTDDIGGLTLHSELESWVKAGIPAGAVLTAATLGGAKLLGEEAQMGVIAVGRQADLYLVDGNPIKDITTIRKGRLVVKGESLFYPDEVFDALNVKPFAPRAALP
jgi:hypothetical protein